MTEINTQIELIVSEIIGATRKAKTLEDLTQANFNGIKDITKLVKNIAVTHCCTELKCEGCKKPLDSGLCANCCSDLSSGNY